MSSSTTGSTRSLDDNDNHKEDDEDGGAPNDNDGPFPKETKGKQTDVWASRAPKSALPPLTPMREKESDHDDCDAR
jgi:hypothetical protein